MIITAAAIAGMMGPALFGTVLLALSALEYDFMLDDRMAAHRGPCGRLT